MFLWVSLSDEIEILLIQTLLLVALSPPFPLLVFDTDVVFLIFVSVYNETFGNLWSENQYASISRDVIPAQTSC